MLSKFLLPIFLAGAVAGPPCKGTRDPPRRPSCTDNCLKDGDVKGVCLDNLREICVAEATDEYFSKHGDCFLDACSDDNDLYSFIETFKKECDAANKPMKKMGGDIGKYFTRPDEEKKTTSTWKPGESTSNSGGDKPTPTSGSETTSETPTPWPTPSKPSTIIVTSTTFEESKSTKATISSAQDQSDSSPTAPPPAETSSSSTAPIPTQPTSPPQTSTTTPSTHPAGSPKKGKPLSTTEIAGATAGGITGFAIAVGVVIYLVFRRRRRPPMIAEPTLPSPAVGPSYTTDRFGNVHSSEWTGTPQYGEGAPGALTARSDAPGGFAQRAFMHRNAGLGTNF